MYSDKSVKICMLPPYEDWDFQVSGSRPAALLQQTQQVQFVRPMHSEFVPQSDALQAK